MIWVPKTIYDYYYFIKCNRSIVLITIDIFNHYKVGIWLTICFMKWKLNKNDKKVRKKIGITNIRKEIYNLLW